MVQPETQPPAMQTSAVPQLVPFAALVHDVVLVPGWQV
jgi:hypothetical protein